MIILYSNYVFQLRSSEKKGSFFISLLIGNETTNNNKTLNFINNRLSEIFTPHGTAEILRLIYMQHILGSNLCYMVHYRLYGKTSKINQS